VITAWQCDAGKKKKKKKNTGLRLKIIVTKFFEKSGEMVI
jgi:hypothetical protein